MWEPRRLTTLWAFRACYRDNFTFLSEHRLRISGNTVLKRIFMPKRKEIIREKYTLRSFIILYALHDEDLRYGSTYSL
jgi:hypothetical protein